MYQNQYSQRLEPGVEFLVLMGIWVGCFIIGSAAAIPIWVIMTGKSVFSMEKEMLNPANINAIKVMQVVSTVIVFFIPAFITARIASQKPFQRLGFHSGLKFNRAIAGILIMLCVLPLVGFFAEINKAIPISAAAKKVFDTLESQYADQVKLIATFKTPLDYIIALFIIALLPAIVEEVFFRGGLQNVLLRWKNNSVFYILLFSVLVAASYHLWFHNSISIYIFYPLLTAITIFIAASKKVTDFLNTYTNYPVVAILATGLIFSVIHFSWFGLVPRMVLGMVLGYIFYYSGNLWYSIIAHFFNNAFMVTILYWQYMKDKKIDMEVGESAPWWAGLISAVVVIGLFIILKKLSATKVTPDSIAADLHPSTDDHLA